MWEVKYLLGILCTTLSQAEEEKEGEAVDMEDLKTIKDKKYRFFPLVKGEGGLSHV
jgi:hypothetical protein